MNHSHEVALVAIILTSVTAMIISHLNEEFSESIDSVIHSTNSTVNQIGVKIDVIEIQQNGDTLIIYAINYGDNEIIKNSIIPTECIAREQIKPKDPYIITCPSDTNKVSLVTENFNVFVMYDGA